MARKSPKSLKYDEIVRGTNDYIPVSFMRQVWVDPETGDPLPEYKYVPFDLTGRAVVLTVKKKEFDGVSPTDQYNGKETHDLALKEAWDKQLVDETAGNEGKSDIDRTIQYDTKGPWDKDYLFRITIDCDDPSEGADGPEDKRYFWQNNYQGMYGMDPRDGYVVFRFSKKMTMLKPGTYYFDIRLMEKMHKQIGMLTESRNWMPISGTFEIVGTPTNRTVIHDWIKGATDGSQPEPPTPTPPSDYATEAYVQQYVQSQLGDYLKNSSLGTGTIKIKDDGTQEFGNFSVNEKGTKTVILTTATDTDKGIVIVDDELDDTSTNPVQNALITNALNTKVDESALATVATSGDYNDLSNRPTIPTYSTFFPVGSIYTSLRTTGPTFGGTWVELGTAKIGGETVYYYRRTA